MKRKLKWLAIVLAVLLLGFGSALLLWPRDQITAESWQKIRIGMTEDEVAEILGGPGMSREEYQAQHKALRTQIGKVPFITNVILVEEDPNKMVREWPTVKTWFGRRGHLLIAIDEEGHVRGKQFTGWRRADPNFLDRL